jgi:hypothetical protein
VVQTSFVPGVVRPRPARDFRNQTSAVTPAVTVGAAQISPRGENASMEIELVPEFGARIARAPLAFGTTEEQACRLLGRFGHPQRSFACGAAWSWRVRIADRWVQASAGGDGRLGEIRVMRAIENAADERAADERAGIPVTYRGIDVFEHPIAQLDFLFGAGAGAAPRADGGTNAGSDGGTNAGSDGGPNAGSATNAGSDGGTNAGLDAGPETSADGGVPLRLTGTDGYAQAATLTGPTRRTTTRDR